MHCNNTSFDEVKIITAKRFGDSRGWFCETFSDEWFRANVADIGFVQDNHSRSQKAGTLRGLHFQKYPNAQAKLVRCTVGSIWDVAVDIRKSSTNFGKWVAAELTAENGDQLFVPVGFAHGFITLTDNTEVVYKCSDYYAPESDGGIAWDDPDIAVEWPIPADGPVLSEKDQQNPLLGQGSFIF